MKIIAPTTISLTTIFKCTAACRNCCFQCNQKNKKIMTFVEMKSYIDKCLKVYSDSISMLVLTGGECPY